MTIRIHVGAHKTASTYLTTCIAAAEQQLLERDFMVLTPANSRDDSIQMYKLLEGSPKANSNRRRARRLMRSLAEDHDVLLISEERILGTIRSRNFLRNDNRIYTGADSRLKRLLDMLGTTDISVFLGVRNPATFLTSAFGEQIRHGGTLSFDEFAGDCDPTAVRWSELVERLVATGISRLVCWCFEDFAALRQSVLGGLVGDDIASQFSADELVRPGLSQSAFDMILANCEGISVQEQKTLVHTAIRKFPREEGHEPLRVFDEKTIGESAARYKEDCLHIAGLPGVEFLRP